MSRWTAALAGAAVWILLTGTPSLASALAGALLGLAAGWFVAAPAVADGSSIRRWSWRALPALVAIFAAEVAKTSVQQLLLVLSPRLQLRPRWAQFDTRLESPRLRMALALMISLTPGTLTVELAGSRLMVHAIDAASAEEVVDAIRQRLERPLLALEGRQA